MVMVLVLVLVVVVVVMVMVKEEKSIFALKIVEMIGRPIEPRYFSVSSFIVCIDDEVPYS